MKNINYMLLLCVMHLLWTNYTSNVSQLFERLRTKIQTLADQSVTSHVTQ
jgi:predicted transcriptional regulator